MELIKEQLPYIVLSSHNVILGIKQRVVNYQREGKLSTWVHGTLGHETRWWWAIKFADDTTVVGLINDETAYREEVRDLAGWCQN